jgi:hypothetical protein
VREEGPANLALAAAAPDLLEALKQLTHECSYKAIPVPREAVAAIAKAEGK